MLFFLFPIHHQFLGHCVELINKEFPHIHVIKGKAQKPTTQGSIEVSHKAFKEALVTWCNTTGSNDWVYGCFIVQNEVNHQPMRTRGNILPHTLYYGAAPDNSYSTVLGAAYSKAMTEFSLRLAKKVLTQLTDHRPDVLATPYMTFIEEDTVGELHQEELVWQDEHQTMLQDEFDE
jgi:hypothetical protein